MGANISRHYPHKSVLGSFATFLPKTVCLCYTVKGETVNGAMALRTPERHLKYKMPSPLSRQVGPLLTDGAQTLAVAPEHCEEVRKAFTDPSPPSQKHPPFAGLCS